MAETKRLPRNLLRNLITPCAAQLVCPLFSRGRVPQPSRKMICSDRLFTIENELVQYENILYNPSNGEWGQSASA